MALEHLVEGGVRIAVLSGERLRTVKEWLVAVERGAIRSRHGTADALLLDFRSAGYTPSARDASALVSALVRRADDRIPPVAVVTADGVQYAGAKILCMMGELRGCVAAAFQDPAAALEWLRLAAAPERDDAPSTEPLGV